MLRSISQICYFMTVCIFISFILVHTWFGRNNGISVGDNIIYLYSIILVPIVVYIYQVSDFSIGKIFSIKSLKENIINILGVFILSGVLYFYWGEQEVFYYLILLIFAILFSIDSRMMFFAAFITLLYVLFFLLTGNQKNAEEVSIVVYYLLCLGIFIEIINTYVTPKISVGKK